MERLGGRWTPRGGMCRCPAHDDRTPSLSVRVGARRLLLHCFAGCDASDVLRACASAGLLDPSGAARDDVALNQSAPSGLNDGARRLWRDARPLAGTPAERYLAARRLLTRSPALRYHPRTPHGPWPFTQFRPALIAAVRDHAGTVAVHRTFLNPETDGLAPLPEPKLALGRFGSGAVRLGKAGTTLGLAEGLETALSAAALFDVPCWATLGTERFRHVAIPAGVTKLMLFLDNDAGGRRAEALAGESFTRVPVVEAHYPRAAGRDWNDVLRARPLARRPDGRGEEAGEG